MRLTRKCCPSCPHSFHFLQQPESHSLNYLSAPRRRWPPTSQGETHIPAWPEADMLSLLPLPPASFSLTPAALRACLRTLACGVPSVCQPPIPHSLVVVFLFPCGLRSNATSSESMSPAPQLREYPPPCPWQAWPLQCALQLCIALSAIGFTCPQGGLDLTAAPVVSLCLELAHNRHGTSE